MPRFDAFCGPDNLSYSPNVTSELTMNWIPERNPVPVSGQGDVQDKNIRCSLVRTPGLRTFVTLPKSPVRGVFPGEYRLFAAAGDSYYEIFSNGSYTDRTIPGFPGSSGNGPAGGSIGNDGKPVMVVFNGNQALIVSAGNAYADNGNGPVPCQYSDPLTDLIVDPADTTGQTLTTATGGNFDASDIGRTVMLTYGPGFNLFDPIVITGVNTTGGALAASPWGVPGSSLGVGVEYLGDITYFDLQLTASNVVVHSPTATFGPSQIGGKLTITSGSGWYPGTYTITGLVYDTSGNPTGDAILSQIAGVPGASGGAGTLESMMVTASQCAFLDGYGFITPDPITKTVYYSAIDDFTSWNPLDFFVKANFPDNVLALLSDHEELYTFGDLESTQVWRDVGDVDNPFQPDPGAVMHIGAQAAFGAVRLGNGVAWLGQDTRRGSRKAIACVGFNPLVVSTPAVEAQWASYTTIADAVAYTYTDAGHEYWIINFPTANATWAYDATTLWWHRRGWYDDTNQTWDRIRGWVHCVVALGGSQYEEQHYVGDWQTGQIYIQSRQYLTDDGNPIVRRRQAPHLTVENKRRFYARFEIDCDVLGTERVYWNRIGTGRDRIWRLDTFQDSETTGVTFTLAYSDDRTQTWQEMYSEALPPGIDVSLCNAYLQWAEASWN